MRVWGSVSSQQAVLSVRGLVKRFGGVTAVNSVSFDVYSGEVFCIVGPNGAGKTTTLRIIAGMLEPDGGDILAFDGRVQW
ncbi:MAG: ATP-binding cassette domain-containing protein, partial [Acidilobaceae archaeon]